MQQRLTILAASLVLALGGAGGVGAVAFAEQSAQESDDVVGTIEVPLGTRLTQDLVDLATVTEAEAVAAAQAALDTSDAPSDVELEIEDGYLVWEVEFPDWEVLVDAGLPDRATAPQVLLIEEEDDTDEGDDEDDDQEEVEGAQDGAN